VNTRDPEINFEKLWTTFHNRYPFFELRNVDWNEQYNRYRPLVTGATGDDELFDIFCRMLNPLNDGHVELTAKINGKKRYFNPEKKPRFWTEFTKKEIKQLFQTTGKTLVVNGFQLPQPTCAWILHYCRSASFGYIRVLELEGISKRGLTTALDTLTDDFDDLDGFIIDIRDCPGGDDSTVLSILDRFCGQVTTAYHRRTKIGPGENDFGPLKTWYIEPKGKTQFTGPIVLLTCDSVFSGGDCFALASRQLPNVTIVGDHTNGIFSYQLEKKLPNGWEYNLSYQVYYSPDMVCYEGKGVSVDIELLNSKTDIETGVDPLIIRALELLRAKSGSNA